MGYIKNFDNLVTNPQRRVVLDLVESALGSIQPEKIVHTNFVLRNHFLTIKGKEVDLSNFERVFLVGFGKGSAKISTIIEEILGDFLTAGWVIDVSEATFKKIEFTLGTHPLPSQANIDFTNNFVEKLSNLTEKDLVIIVTCGGGSVMFTNPHKLTSERIIEINKTLLHSGADITEMNAVRKHLDLVKGGGFAKIIFPAAAFNLIFSDVPGNDLSVIASGPSVRDKTTVDDAWNVLSKYEIAEKLALTNSDFIESPKEDKYFEKVNNILMVSNQTALEAMKQKAVELDFLATIYSDSFQGDANEAGKKLIEQTPPGSILLAGGETTLKVTGHGEGGRNQHLVLASLPYIKYGVVIASFDSDGWDNTPACGAIADFETLKKVEKKQIDANKYLQANNSFTFFQDVGDAILTDRLPSNVSDLMIVLKK